jgi:hypothetical protein
VERPVVQIAEGREVAQIVAATAALVLDMVQIEPDVPAAPGYGAAVAISREHLLALARRDGRGRSLRRGGIERAEMDGVAGSALGHGRIDLDVPAAAVLPCTLAVWTLLDRELVDGRASALAITAAAATLAVRPAEYRGDQLVIGESLAVLLGGEGVHLAPDVICLGRDLERERLAVEARLGLVGGKVTRAVARDQRLDLAQTLATRCSEPGIFGIRHGNSRELAHRRMRELATLQRLCEQGQLGDRACNAEALGRRMWRIAHYALHVLEERAESVSTPKLQLFGIAQQVRFLGIERSSPRRDVTELLVYSCPLRFVLALPRFRCNGVICPRANAKLLLRSERGDLSMGFVRDMELLIQHIADESSLLRDCPPTAPRVTGAAGGRPRVASETLAPARPPRSLRLQSFHYMGG